MLTLVKFPNGKLSNELVFDKENYKDAEIIGPALVDPVLNRVELAGWLELKDGKVEINQAEKEKILAQEIAAKEVEENKKLKRKQAKEKIKDLDVDNSVKSLQDLKALLKDIIELIKDEKPTGVQPSNAVESRLFIDGKRVK